jgi:hypothetical protein
MRKYLSILVAGLLISITFFNSCKKTEKYNHDNKTSGTQNLFNKPQKIFSGHIPRTNKGVKNLSLTEPSCYNTSYELWYTITSLPCGTLTTPNPIYGTTNDYQIDWHLAIYPDPALCTGKGSPQDPEMQNFSITFQSIIIGDQSPTSPTYFDACGYSVSGSYQFSQLGIFSITNFGYELDIDVTGEWISTNYCGGNAEGFQISNIQPLLVLHPCTNSYGTAPIAPINPNSNGSGNSFDIFFPWDNVTCFSASFMPDQYASIQVEYYKPGYGVYNASRSNPAYGPWVIPVYNGGGTYYVRARYVCNNAIAPWSSWHQVSV